MNKVSKEKTLKALKETIERWERIRDEGEDVYYDTECPLCELFVGDDKQCVECPIQRKTDEKQCWYTPFWDYVYDKTKEKAQKEVDFLKDLYIEMLEDYSPPLDKSKRDIVPVPSGGYICPSCDYVVMAGKVMRAEYRAKHWRLQCPKCLTWSRETYWVSAREVEKKAEPKEEWEDITPDCVVKIDQPLNGYYHLTFWHKEKHIAYTDMYKDGCPEATEIIQDSRIDNYKIEKEDGDFRIMRRVEK